jgi:hypothetical protein
MVGLLSLWSASPVLIYKYRDFDAPSGPILADTSAGMIAANGMLLLSQHERSVRNTTGETYWINAAVEVS